MKKLSIILSLFFLASCSKDLESLNTNIKDATSASGESFFNMASKNMADAMHGITYGSGGSPWETTRLLAQQISSVTYNEGTTYYSQFTWTSVYRGVLKNLDESAKVTAATPTVGAAGLVRQKNQLAITEIMTVFAYSTLVESFGDIPYNEAVNIDNVLPKYDEAKTVYTDLLKRLSTAINNLDVTGKSFDADIIYKGNVASWKKFANSLKLKMGMRIIDADPTLGSATVIAAAPGAFTSNADNAVFRYLVSPPNMNPLWTSLAVGNRRDLVAAKPFVDLMNATNDPRRPIFFTNVNGAYIGAPSGVVVTYESYSRFSDRFYQPDLPGIIMDYATVAFLLAEAAERSIINTPARAAAQYEKAITASFDYYGVGSSVAEYLKQSEVDYTTAKGSWKEKIGKQKWLALFNQGFEAWTEYRRLDYPALAAPPGSFINVVPKRLTYPISEQTLNGANYKSASAAVGNDLMTTRLFFDKY
ncbi:MAG: hypothetical protein JWQ40_2431 [Segetibacter sp.]|nr:hypothetical protein [Segetibacter sp.]